MKLQNIQIIFLLVLAAAAAVGCSTGQVSYNTQKPPVISIPAVRQPVYLSFRDIRQDKPAPPVFRSEEERRGALNPEVLQEEVYKDPVGNFKKLTEERLFKNGIQLSDQENDNSVTIEISKYSIIYESASNMWKAHVILSVTSDLHSQGINTTFQKANVSGNSDGFGVLSTAVSMSIDRISWDRHFAE